MTGDDGVRLSLLEVCELRYTLGLADGALSVVARTRGFRREGASEVRERVYDADQLLVDATERAARGAV